jgi:hypothetical protein
MMGHYSKYFIFKTLPWPSRHPSQKIAYRSLTYIYRPSLDRPLTVTVHSIILTINAHGNVLDGHGEWTVKKVKERYFLGRNGDETATERSR